ncbi:WW domain-binding protein 11 [Anopheles gambiae]|uniref:Wbp11/ELF5/Saf1 N-terminal domain-containing protein n=4 Tax=gambiae species complex TaxID=44542 RepID=A0A1S4HDT9_ANOGA|nr:WW domain-binding protein 11 [Anopheles coluzzii]XP_061510925.1 WW domain-binding protein 11 [Anopheles gambiae]
MGRRSINTTKSGKYMNPTDQARKEARKKELKKNKKQRQMVRAAVLKGKDPAQLIEEMEKIDEMEFNVYQPSPLNEKVLKEKRKKLKETLDRVMRLYQADDPELWADLKRKEVDYEKRRNKRIQYYESVRHAEQVQVDDIPLPSATETPTPLSIPRIPMPPSVAPPSIVPPLRSIPPPAPLLKKPVENPIEPTEPVDDDDDIPGCPPGPPPDLFDMPELDFDLENFHAETQKSVKFYDDGDSKDNTEESDGEKTVKQPNTVQQKMLALSGQNIDDFMKEMESVQKKKEQSTHDTPSLSSIPTPSAPPLPNPAPAPDAAMPKFMPMPSSIPMPGPPGSMQSLMIRPPPLRPPGMGGMPAGLRMPGRPGIPGGPPPVMPPRMGIRMPPGPPAGPPPKHIQQQRNMQLHQQAQQQQQQQLLQQKDPKSATISAKPQIRNLSADVTRFVPSALRAKKDDVRKAKPPARPVHDQHDPRTVAADPSKPTKDDAYLQFMREMEDLL